jgi:hypothetical protein
VDLKPAPNNKEIYNVEFLQQCKVKFKPPKQSRTIAQCANCQHYGHTRNYCHLKPRCVKCAGSHSTSQCLRKEKSNDVRCVLCGGNHPANYKGCMIYKDLQKKTFPPLRPKIYTPPILLKQSLPDQSSLSYAQITKGNLPSHPTHTDEQSPINFPQPYPPPQQSPTSQQNSEITALKSMMKALFDQLGSLLNLLTTVLTKIR